MMQGYGNIGQVGQQDQKAKGITLSISSMNPREFEKKKKACLFQKSELGSLIFLPSRRKGSNKGIVLQGLVPLAFTCIGSLKGKLRRKWSVLITLGLGANI